MMRKLTFLTGLAAYFILQACTPESKPISYGTDKCDFCRMSIVDQRFAGEIVTTKGKVYMFDAVECMVHYIDEHAADEPKMKLILTNTWDRPGTLNDARDCYYLRSKNMPSPMGKYLNPFHDLDEAKKHQQQNTGELFNWKELRANFEKWK